MTLLRVPERWDTQFSLSPLATTDDQGCAKLPNNQNTPQSVFFYYFIHAKFRVSFFFTACVCVGVIFSASLIQRDICKAFKQFRLGVYLRQILDIQPWPSVVSKCPAINSHVYVSPFLPF